MILTTPDETQHEVAYQISNLTITGKADGGSGKLSLKIENHDVPVNADGSFSTNAPLRVGKNTIKVDLSDASGKRLSKSITIERKTLPPLRFTVTGVTETLSTTDETVNINGSVYAEGLRTEVSVNDTPVQTDSEGNFKQTVNLSIGKNKIIVTAKDASGRIDNKTFIVTRKEKTPPKISLEFPNEDKKTLRSKPDGTTLKGKIAGGVGQLALTIDKRNVNVNNDGSFSAPLSLKPGKNIIDLEVVDAAGNRDKQSWIIYNNIVGK